MKISELRIGNLVNRVLFEEDGHTVSGKEVNTICGILSPSLNICFLEDKDAWWNIGIAEPIPITEERLLKFGFLIDELKGFDRCNGVVIYSNNKIDISFEDKKFNLWFETDEDNWYNFKHIEIKQVHQLQNLYFALTGKELKKQP